MCRVQLSWLTRTQPKLWFSCKRHNTSYHFWLHYIHGHEKWIKSETFSYSFSETTVVRNLILPTLRHKIGSPSCYCVSDPTRFHEFIRQKSYEQQRTEVPDSATVSWASWGKSVNLSEDQFTISKMETLLFCLFLLETYSVTQKNVETLIRYLDPGIIAIISDLNLLPKSQETWIVSKYSSRV